MAKKGAPTPPDPYKVIEAQTASNIQTAGAQAQMNNVDQVTPGGTLRYTRTVDANGVPHYTATTELGDAEQQIYDTSNQASQNLAEVARNGASRLQTPLDLSNDATEARLMELGRKRLDPLLAQRRQDTETDLINRGIRPGSTNYAQAHDISTQGENDAYDQLLLQGRQQSVSEALAGRNQLLNEVNAARSGSQVQNPNFVSTPQTGVAGTDVAGTIQNDYNTRNQAYQQQQSDMWGGLFGLGRAAIGIFSDKRLKTNIKPTGAKVRGVPVKTWNWKSTGEADAGVIAQDVQKKHPGMVHTDPATGYKKVEYGRLMRPMRRAA